jgi:hypothetical protein
MRTGARLGAALAVAAALALGSVWSAGAAAGAAAEVGGGAAAGVGGGAEGAAGGGTLCGQQTAPVAGGGYIVQNDEYNSGATECVAASAVGAAFRVASSSIANPVPGAPGAFPSVYQGCHWGRCTPGGLGADPVQVADMFPGEVTTSWVTTQPGGDGAYDVAYDIWINKAPVAAGAPEGTELMVWLNHNGPVRPAGTEVATDVTIGDRTYDVWDDHPAAGGNLVAYVLTSPVTAVRGLDVAGLVLDTVARGYTNPEWYLISVEAGFELWQGGGGLATRYFAVNVADHWLPWPAFGHAIRPG